MKSYQAAEISLSSIIYLQQIYWKCRRRGGALPPLPQCRGFSLMGEIRGVPPVTIQKLAYPIHPLPPNFYSAPTKQKSSSYNSIKTVFFPASIFVLISYSLNTQVMLNLFLIDVQYSQKAVFSLKKVRIVNITPPHVPFAR